MAPSDDGTLATERTAWPPGTTPPDDVVTMLRLALDGLPGPQQSAIRLAMTERLPVTDIATRLGTSAAEVMDAMRDGLTTLRDVLAHVNPNAATPEPTAGPAATHR